MAKNTTITKSKTNLKTEKETRNKTISKERKIVPSSQTLHQK